MAHTPLSDDAQQPPPTSKTAPKEPLIHVHPYAHMDPGANERCPVCGQPYAQGGILVRSASQAPAPAATETAEQAATSGQHSVIRCAHCGTYSVGTLRPFPNSPKDE